jgi:protein-disulfide isomerase
MDTTNNVIDNKYFLPASVILAGLLIAGAVIYNGQNPVAPVAAPQQGGAPAQVDADKVDIAGDPFIGKANAPVTIIAWADFQCPFCKKFEDESFGKIVTQYVNTGKVKFVFQDFAFLGPDSMDAAVYGRAIWKLYPNLYLTWREKMYAAQDEENGGSFGNAASIERLTASIEGIDAAKVTADVVANRIRYEDLVTADRAEGGKWGIGATPSFIIGNQLVQGAMPFDTFKAAIDAQL